MTLPIDLDWLAAIPCNVERELLRTVLSNNQMVISQRLRLLRQQKGLSQGEIEKAGGLVRGYISRIERGQAVPSLETLQRLASALEVPLYRLFYEGEDAPATPHLTPRCSLEELADEAGPFRSFRGRR
jgi:transcriptional regulator with XRE-family HTH domain